jgi:hypothetical protein
VFQDGNKAVSKGQKTGGESWDCSRVPVGEPGWC